MSNNAINVSALSSVIVTNEDGILSSSGAMTSGQMLIGSTGSKPVAASLTASSGLVVTPSAGALTIGAVTGGNLINVQYLTTSGTYTATTGTNSCLVLAVAAGGGGAGCPNAASGAVRVGGGGGGGAACYKYYSTAPTGTAYVIGAGGAGGVAGTNPGSAGGATTFNNGDMNVLGGNGGIANGSTTAFSTLGGLVDPSDNSDYFSLGGPSPYFLFTGTTFDLAVGSAGGVSGLGIGQGGFTVISALTSSNPGQTPTGFGGGGSGGVSSSGSAAAAGAAGAPGGIIVWEYS